MNEKTKILDEAAITIKRISHEILEKTKARKIFYLLALKQEEHL